MLHMTFDSWAYIWIMDWIGLTKIGEESNNSEMKNEYLGK